MPYDQKEVKLGSLRMLYFESAVDDAIYHILNS